MTSAIGTIHKFGIDTAKGPYTEDILFFDGVKGTYFQKVIGKTEDSGGWFKRKIDSNPKNKTVSFILFKPRSTNLGKNYIFELFSKPQEE